MTRPTTAADIFTQLKAPFHSNDIEWKLGGTNKDQSKGRALPYLKFQAVADRLDAVLGETNWTNTYVSGPAGGVVCKLSLRIETEWLTKENGAGNTDKEGVKGGLSDAFKRAATMFGVGRYLHSYSAILVDLDEHGRWTAPALPDEFLPAEEVEQRRKDYEQYEADVAAGRIAAPAAAAAPVAEAAVAESPAVVAGAPAAEDKVEPTAKAARARAATKSAPVADETAGATTVADAGQTAPEGTTSVEQATESDAAAPAPSTTAEAVTVTAAPDTAAVAEPAAAEPAAAPVVAESTPAPAAAPAAAAGPVTFALDEKGYPLVPEGLTEAEVKLLANLVARAAKAEKLDPVRDYLINGKGQTALGEVARQYLFAYVDREEAIRKEATAA